MSSGLRSPPASSGLRAFGGVGPRPPFFLPACLFLPFAAFFEERRPFFVEGTGLYEFRLNCFIVVDCSTNEGLFYSRRIGQSPRGDAAGETGRLRPVRRGLRRERTEIRARQRRFPTPQ